MKELAPIMQLAVAFGVAGSMGFRLPFVVAWLPAASLGFPAWHSGTDWQPNDLLSWALAGASAAASCFVASWYGILGTPSSKGASVWLTWLWPVLYFESGLYVDLVRPPIPSGAVFGDPWTWVTLVSRSFAMGVGLVMPLLWLNAMSHVALSLAKPHHALAITRWFPSLLVTTVMFLLARHVADAVVVAHRVGVAP